MSPSRMKDIESFVWWVGPAGDRITGIIPHVVRKTIAIHTPWRLPGVNSVEENVKMRLPYCYQRLRKHQQQQQQ